MSRGTMLYIRVQQGVIEDLMKVTHNRQILKDKSALAIICETLLEWAAANAAYGEEAERLIMQRDYMKEYRSFYRKKKMLDESSPERIEKDAKRTKDIVLDSVSDYFKRRKEKNDAEPDL